MSFQFTKFSFSNEIMKYSIRLKGQVVQTIESKTPQNQAKITDG